MVEIKNVARVDTEKCLGCAVCQNVCPTEAILVVNKKAEVSPEKCVACPNCSGMCPEDAVELVPRAEPLKLGLNWRQVDQDRLVEMCRKAHLHPHQWLCLCSAVRVRDGAAAILKGARSPEEIALMTGARTGCTVYCFQTMMRLLKAHGVEIEPQKGYRWYDSTQTLWDVPEEIVKKYPGHFLEEDKDVFRKI
ncbi:MAG: 4Fe-4S binding protein [Desulfomonilaceae bacterium]|nr:4Fe-4S binding protein [Desulfomonilaceae bacterium]